MNTGLLKKPSKPYGVYYWDTFEEMGEGAMLIGEFDTLDQANKSVLREFGPDNRGKKIRPDGADLVHIVHFVDGEGTVVAEFKVG